LEIDPDNCLAFVNRGKNKKRIDDYMEAIKDFDNAISTKGGEYIYFDKVENSFVETGFEFDVEMEAIRFERGIAYSFIQNYEKSLRDFEFCIQKNYSLPDCHYWTGLIYLNTGLNQKACEHLYKAKELGDPDAEDLIRKNCK
jgi:tetratricopeptide (TPR) repeat protein